MAEFPVSPSRGQAQNLNIPKITNPLEKLGLQVVQYGSAAFQFELARLLTPEAIAKAEPFLPRSVIVLNQTGRYLWGFTIVYVYPDQITASGKRWTHAVSAIAGVNNRARMMSPDAAYLVTPVGGFRASRHEDGRRSLQPILDEGLDRVISLYTRDLMDKRVLLEADSMILEDGTLIGPDRIGKLQKLNEQARADKELADALSPLSVDELRRTLQLYSNIGANDAYTFQRFGRANMLLSILDSSGEVDARAAIQQFGSCVRFTGGGDVRALIISADGGIPS